MMYMYDLWNRTGQWLKGLSSSYFDSATMNIPASTWPTLRIGRTFDATNSSAGIDIYPPNIRTKKTNVNRFKFDYRVVKNSSDTKKLLDISGDFSLKAKAGLLKLGGSGRFLEDNTRKEGTTEVLVVLKCITACETMDGLQKVVDEVASGRVREGLGTHVVRGVTYGMELVASLSIKTSSSSEKLDIRGSVEGPIKAGAADVTLKAQLRNLTSQCSDLSDIAINYYATGLPDKLPTSLDELVKLVEKFPSRLDKINDGQGVPLQYELLPINTAIRTREPLVQYKLSTTAEESVEERLDDLLSAKALLKKYEESGEDVHDDDEDDLLNLKEEITKVMEQFKEAISLMNSEGGKDKIDSCLEAYHKALDGRNIVGKFSKKCKTILKSKEPAKAASSIKLPKGEPLTVLLLGKVGNGKSATGNIILGRDVFTTSDDPKAVTKSCRMERREDEREIEVIDTPGVMDYSAYPGIKEESLKQVAQAFAMAPLGFHAICLVMRYGLRFTEEDEEAFRLLQKVTGEKAEKHMFLIVTFADEAEKRAKQKKVPLDEWVTKWIEKLPAPLVKVFIEQIGEKRVFLFDNTLEKDSDACKKQLSGMIQSIDDSLRNTGGPFVHDQLTKPSQDELNKRIKEAVAGLDKKKDDLEKVKKEIEKRIKRGGLDENERKKLGDRLTEVDQELKDIAEQKTGIIKNVTRSLVQMTESRSFSLILNATVAVLTGIIGNRVGGCFPESATLVDKHGHRRKMSSIFMGENVQVITNNKISTDPVITFIHRQPEVMQEFLEITTLKEKKVLKITEDHLLFVEKEGQAAAVPAKDVIIGDTVYVRAYHGALEKDAVHRISRVYENGVYAPVTLSGTILVDDVHTSCYFDVLSHEWSHRAMGVARAVHHVSPWMLQWLSGVGEKDGFPGWCRLAHKMLTWMD